MGFDRAAQSTDNRIVSTSRAYVVYDKTTGDVLHIHHSVSFAHGVPVGGEDAMTALRLAGNRAGPNADVIEMESAELNQRGLLRIDTSTRTVVWEKR